MELCDDEVCGLLALVLSVAFNNGGLLVGLGGGYAHGTAGDGAAPDALPGGTGLRGSLLGHGVAFGSTVCSPCKVSTNVGRRH